MKANWLVILMVLFVTSAFNITALLSFDRPSIKIKEVNVKESYRGKVVCYKINLYSPSHIKDFVAVPNIASASQEPRTRFEFNNHTRRATVLYYYAVPENVNPEKLSIKFCLNNELTQIDSTSLSFVK